MRRLAALLLVLAACSGGGSGGGDDADQPAAGGPGYALLDADGWQLQEAVDPPARGKQDRMPSSRVPLSGRAQPRIDVGFPFRDDAEFQARAD